MTNDEIKPFADKVLQYIYEQPNEESPQHLPTILDSLKLDQSLRQHITDFLAHEEKLKVTFPQGTAAAFLSLTSYGREYARKINPPKMTEIEEACEKIFQLHKTDHSIRWTKEAYHAISHSSEALPLMLRTGIIYSEPVGNSKRTRLEPFAKKADSYEEALHLLEEKNKPKVLAEIKDSFNTKTINKTYGANSPIASDNSNNEQTFNPESKDTKKKHWLLQGLKWIWEQLKKPVIAAITSAIVGFFTGRATNRENIQSDNPTLFQSTSQQTTGDTSKETKKQDSARFQTLP